VNIAGSISDEVIGFSQFTYSFQLHDGPGSTQPLTEMSTRNLPGGNGLPARKVDLTAFFDPTV
jgi:hypothetical protein